ncbi:hypothetical protein BCR34DRAFT_566311 [Clohesyomyces aquaticus]|uniref:AB hydrolase-1 domain-containing protein n=1 Tax=Clohesyomyces aquaticus TaxID=1231657 RepID=A0A1Y1ZKM1_9PLEO|nr:hypothetical protein BCR34DRAFT_566311 [Clohesyomyces aquaticus]
MIGTSVFDYVFIRSCIIFLHWIAPLSILYCAISLVYPLEYPGFKAVQIWAALETAFYFLVYHPRRIYLQRAATHPTLIGREDRRALFRRCNQHIPNAERYLSKWFMDAPSSEIKRENVEEWLRWAFLNTAEDNPADQEELEEYLGELERVLGRKIVPGRGTAACLRLTLDKVDMLHRSITWYLCVSVVDTLASAYMRYHSFHLYRTSIIRFPTVFPFRPLTFLARHRSPAETLTYWHRPHTSKTGLPILFIHGIGIGLYPYVNFLAELNPGGSDSDVGVIALEIMPVSFRITGKALQKEEMCKEIDRILKAHGWDRFVLVSHSYGSVVATHLLHTSHIAEKVASTLFIDPVTFLLHLPDVAYNFICRKPVQANEHQLFYFASRDMGVSHTLSRHFFWSENILWKEDLQGHNVTVSLSGRDLIVDTATVKAYLTSPDDAGKEMGKWEDGIWKGDDLNLLWFPKLDHAQVFDKKRTRQMLVDIVRGYCNVK